ncbi:hypothetical protein RhiJN_11602 [Ceratobasidium sp. AG-Ba]|nr:hypothetical protein RhiJN_11602 [Ceratobasidium sp. AG-Ba]
MTEELKHAIEEYFFCGYTDKDITAHLLEKHIDKSKYSLSVQSFVKIRKSLGLESTRGQGHTIESANAVISAARARHPSAGINELRNIVRTESGGSTRIPRSVVEAWAHQNEPRAVEARKGRIVVKKPFLCSGVNEIWSINQHDKFQVWGLWLHVCVDAYSGYVVWLRVWWTNSNPRLICSYYLDAVESSSPPAVPLLTQSDAGSENYHVADAQTTLRQMTDPSLQGSRQHGVSQKHGNIKSEQFWSGMSERASSGLKQFLQLGIEDESYDSTVPLLVARRANVKSILPHDAPIRIYEQPEKYGGKDYKARVQVSSRAVTLVRQMYADPSDSVFQLLHPGFQDHAEKFYAEARGEPLTRENGWYYYHKIVEGFRHLELGRVLQEEIQLQGQLFQNLLALSHDGRARGLAWNYPAPQVPVEFANAPEETSSNIQDQDILTAELSGEEDILPLPGHDW